MTLDELEEGFIEAQLLDEASMELESAGTLPVIVRTGNILVMPLLTRRCKRHP